MKINCLVLQLLVLQVKSVVCRTQDYQTFPKYTLSLKISCNKSKRCKQSPWKALLLLLFNVLDTNVLKFRILNYL